MFKDKLKKLRINSGLSQEQLANKLGYARTTISAYEIGRNEPSYEDLKKISKIFSITIDELLDNDFIPENKEENIIIPEEFTNAEDARKYVAMHTIFSSGGVRPERLGDDEIIEFANALLEQMKMVSYKYKK